MTLIETSIKINKPVEQVFDFITNLDNMKKMSEYVVNIEVDGPLKLGSVYQITSSNAGNTIVSKHEVVAFEKNKTFAIKTFAPPPAADAVNTTLLEADGAGTKMTLQIDAELMSEGDPQKEAALKNQVTAGFNAMLVAMKQAIEG